MTPQQLTTTPKHTKQTFSYAASIAWYKLSYYGWRTILFFLFFDEADKSSIGEVTDLLFWFSMAVLTAYLVGGVLGDLLIGNKRALLFGGALMFIGSILYFFDASMSSYLPIGLFAVGAGLYQSNLKAIYAKLYLHDTRLLDSGFMILYWFINLGSFFGAFLVGMIAEIYGVEYGFLAVGISTLLSMLMLLLVKKPTQVTVESVPEQKSMLNKVNLKYLAFFLGMYAFYYLVYRLVHAEMMIEYWEIDFGTYATSNFWIDMLNLIFYMIIGIYLIILFSKKHYNRITKLTIATVLTLLSFGASYLFYIEGATSTTVLTIIALFIYIVADLFISPLIESTIAKVVNQRFLAIAYGSVGLVVVGMGYVFTYFRKGVEFLTNDSIYAGLAGLSLLSIILVLRVRKRKKAQ